MKQSTKLRNSMERILLASARFGFANKLAIRLIFGGFAAMDEAFGSTDVEDETYLVGIPSLQLRRQREV